MANAKQNADNIQVVRPKVEGAVFVADAGTPVPTSTDAKSPTGFDSLGWISEDGITMTVDKETTDVKGFGGDTAFTLQESHTVTFTMKPVELNGFVLERQFGKGNVTHEGGVVSAFVINADDTDEFSMVIDLRGRAGQLIRLCVPRAKVTALAETSIKHNEPMAAEWTVTAYADASGNKVYGHVAKAGE